jgi:uncharacterized protein (TIGR02466 family)
MSLANLFSTPIWIDQPTVENYDPIQLEVQACLKRIKEEQDYHEVSHIYPPAKQLKMDEWQGGEKYTHMISDDLIGKFGLKLLEARIYQALDYYNQYVRPFSTEAPGKWKIRNSWMNIAITGAYHDFHSHPGYTVAGTYYFRVSELQGGINFNSSNPMMYNHQFPAGKFSPGSVSFIPKDGQLMLWPAWLQHSTEPNQSTTEERISISFNIDYIQD